MPTRLVVVVHGVGDPKPGDAITALVSGFCAKPNAQLHGVPLVRHEIDDSGQPGSDEFLHTFPIHQIDTIKETDDGAVLTRFVEVYWGDLSRVKGTISGLFFGFVDLVFGLRHIVVAAQRELSELTGSRVTILASSASWLARMSMSLNRGPVLSLNILAAIVAVMFLGETLLFEPSIKPVHWSLGNWEILVEGESWSKAVYENSGTLGIPIGCGISVILGLLLLSRARRLGWSTTTAWSMLSVGTVSAGIFFYAWTNSRVDYLNYKHFVEVLTGFLSVAAGLVAIAVCLMIFVSVITYLVAYMGPKENCRPTRQSLTVINVCAILSSALFVLLVMVAWALAVQKLGDDVLSNRIKAGLHLFALVWLTFLLVAFTYLILGLNSWWLNKKKNTSVTYPRYIVGWPAVVILVISGVLWSGMFLRLGLKLECGTKGFLWLKLGLCNLFGPFKNVNKFIDPVIKCIEENGELAILLSVFVVSSLIFMQTHLGAALDIVIDVISHFKLPKRTKSGQTKNALWTSMVNRFHVVANGALSGNNFDFVTVVSHSQGTMIALDALGIITIKRKEDEEHQAATPPNYLESYKRKITLVTMGSPLTYLYEHYFPKKYAIKAIDDTCLVNWINIYRLDDFVGRKVENRNKNCFPKNIPVEPRGHVNYWSDKAVLNLLVDPDNGVL
jgi:hypothetical protein